MLLLQPARARAQLDGVSRHGGEPASDLLEPLPVQASQERSAVPGFRLSVESLAESHGDAVLGSRHGACRRPRTCRRKAPSATASASSSGDPVSRATATSGVSLRRELGAVPRELPLLLDQVRVRREPGARLGVLRDDERVLTPTRPRLRDADVGVAGQVPREGPRLRVAGVHDERRLLGPAELHELGCDLVVGRACEVAVDRVGPQGEPRQHCARRVGERSQRDRGDQGRQAHGREGGHHEQVAGIEDPQPGQPDERGHDPGHDGQEGAEPPLGPAGEQRAAPARTAARSTTSPDIRGPVLATPSRWRRRPSTRSGCAGFRRPGSTRSRGPPGR